MSANAPEIQVLADADTTAIIKVTGYYTSATGAANTKIVTANSLVGGNTSKTCFVDVEKVQYAIGTANGYLSLEYVGGAGGNANTKIVNFGKHQAAEIVSYIPNNATSPTGDISLFTSALDANDSYSLVITLRKRNVNGCFANLYVNYN